MPLLIITDTKMDTKIIITKKKRVEAMKLNSRTFSITRGQEVKAIKIHTPKSLIIIRMGAITNQLVRILIISNRERSPTLITMVRKVNTISAPTEEVVLEIPMTNADPIQGHTEQCQGSMARKIFIKRMETTTEEEDKNKIPKAIIVTKTINMGTKMFKRKHPNLKK